MAECERKEIHQPKYTYVLTLNEAEAGALLNLFWYVGGSADTTDRGLIRAIDNALLATGALRRRVNCTGVVTFPTNK